MRYRVMLKPLRSGGYYARCNAAPGGVAEARGDTATRALDKLRLEIRYQLEYCPCSGVTDDYVEIEVVDSPDPRGQN